MFAKLKLTAVAAVTTAMMAPAAYAEEFITIGTGGSYRLTSNLDLSALDPTFPDVLNFATNNFRVRIDPAKSGETDTLLRFDFGDGNSAALHVRRAVAEFIEDPDAYGRQPDIVLKLSADAWAKLYLSEATLDDLIVSGDLEVAAGDAAAAARVLDAFDRYDPSKAVVVPPTTLVQDHM